jgi:hypothetical protein
VIRLHHIVDWFASHIPAAAGERTAELAGVGRADN